MADFCGFPAIHFAAGKVSMHPQLRRNFGATSAQLRRKDHASPASCAEVLTHLQFGAPFGARNPFTGFRCGPTKV